jgi:hypothetical protein
LSLDNYSKNPHIEELEKLYLAINDMNMRALPMLSLSERLILRQSHYADTFDARFQNIAERVVGKSDILSPENLRTKDSQFYETFIKYDQVKIPVKIPLITFTSEIGEVKCDSSLGPFN